MLVMVEKIELHRWKCTCIVCGNTWITRTESLPLVCPGKDCSYPPAWNNATKPNRKHFGKVEVKQVERTATEDDGFWSP